MHLARSGTNKNSMELWLLLVMFFYSSLQNGNKASEIACWLFPEEIVHWNVSGKHSEREYDQVSGVRERRRITELVVERKKEKRRSFNEMQ